MCLGVPVRARRYPALSARTRWRYLPWAPQSLRACSAPTWRPQHLPAEPRANQQAPARPSAPAPQPAARACRRAARTCPQHGDIPRAPDAGGPGASQLCCAVSRSWSSDAQGAYLGDARRLVAAGRCVAAGHGGHGTGTHLTAPRASFLTVQRAARCGAGGATLKILYGGQRSSSRKHDRGPRRRTAHCWGGRTALGGGPAGAALALGLALGLALPGQAHAGCDFHFYSILILRRGPVGLSAGLVMSAKWGGADLSTPSGRGGWWVELVHVVHVHTPGPGRATPTIE